MKSYLFTVVSVAAAMCLFSDAATAEEKSPNIVWIVAEDMSATLGCYQDAYANTPHIDRLSRRGVRYAQAFASAPVCSPARSCLITGCYAPSTGTQPMRSAFPLPKKIRGFPALLRQRGYYTTNNVKTDYNTGSWREIIKASWDESSDTAHWRNRPRKNQPFFSVFNLMTTHQSRTMVWSRERFVEQVQSRLSDNQIHDPAAAPLPPYYPDTPVVRRTVARFYDCVSVMDQEVGAILKQLQDDGLADDTIVFFYSDHGSGMPRHKRALLDSGMHVPLLIHFPKKYQQWAPASAGQVVARLVSFVDFAPTVLSLAGATIPNYMQGKAFLGKNAAAPRKWVFGHRDRVDEAFDLARSVRGKRYLYIRNYMPHLGYNQPTAWPDLGDIRHEFYRITDSSGVSAPLWNFVKPTRPPEELYDCEQDPLNLHNLAASPEHASVLARMRQVHLRHLQTTKDLAFFPESAAWKLFAGSNPWDAARRPEFDSAGLLALYRVAADVGLAEAPAFLAHLKSGRPAVRYWGAIGLTARKTLTATARRRLEETLKDESPAVRIAAADALARHGGEAKAAPVLVGLLQHDDLNVVLHAARTIEMLGEKVRSAVPAMQQLATRAEALRPANTPATFVLSPEQDLAMFCSFAAQGFLSRVEKNDSRSR